MLIILLEIYYNRLLRSIDGIVASQSLSNRGSAINVKFIYRNYRPIHSTFQSMIDNPPEGVRYSIDPVKRRPNALFMVYRKFGSNRLVRCIIQSLQRRLFSQKIDSDIDILHVVDMIIDESLWNKTPYIVDIGYIGALANHSGMTEKIKLKIRAYLLHSNCQAIIARSVAAKESILNVFDTDTDTATIASKLNVVYPSYTPPLKKDDVWSKKEELLRTDEDFKILFIGNYVVQKGLLELAEACRVLQGKGRSVSLRVISKDSTEELNSYLKEIDRVDILPANFSTLELIEEHYIKSHVFIMPSHLEVFGMVLIEALNSATPPMAINQYSTPEIIKHGVNGYLIDSDNTPMSKENPQREDFDKKNFIDVEAKVVEQIVALVEGLIDNPQSLKDLSYNALYDTHNDKFSSLIRNKTLKEIYEKAIS